MTRIVQLWQTSRSARRASSSACSRKAATFARARVLLDPLSRRADTLVAPAAPDHLSARLPLREPLSAPRPAFSSRCCDARCGPRPVVPVRRPGPGIARPAARRAGVRDRRRVRAVRLRRPPQPRRPRRRHGADRLFSGLQDFRHVENPPAPRRCARPGFPSCSVAGPIRHAIRRSWAELLQLHQPGLHARQCRHHGPSGTAGGGERHLLVARRAERPARRRRLPGPIAWVFGGAFHVITGSNRLESRRAFADTTYRWPATARGVVRRCRRSPGRDPEVRQRLQRGGYRALRRARQRRPGLDPVGHGGSAVHLRPRAPVAARVPSSSWPARPHANLVGGQQRPAGAGRERSGQHLRGVVRRRIHARSPASDPAPDPVRRALRTLPFTLVPGEQPHEFGVSAGSGLRFAQDRAGIDLGLEHVWRSAGAFSERSFLVSVGVTVRP